MIDFYLISPLQGNDAGLISRLVTFSQDNGVPVYFKTINPAILILK